MTENDIQNRSEFIAKAIPKSNIGQRMEDMLLKEKAERLSIIGLSVVLLAMIPVMFMDPPLWVEISANVILWASVIWGGDFMLWVLRRKADRR